MKGIKPTLLHLRLMIVGMYIITGLLIYVGCKFIKPPPIKLELIEDTNGYMWNSDYVWGRIP